MLGHNHNLISANSSGLLRRALLQALHSLQQTHHWSVKSGKLTCSSIFCMISLFFCLLGAWEELRGVSGIGGTRFISFEGRHWHNDCFICSSCKSSMVRLETMHSLDSFTEKLFCPYFLLLLSASTNSGGEGFHHRRGGHHLPGVRQEEADGGHCGAVAPLLHPSILFSQTTTTTTTTTNRLLNCVRKLSHPLNANPLLQKLVSFLFLKRYLSKSAFRYSYPILKSLQACQLN